MKLYFAIEGMGFYFITFVYLICSFMIWKKYLTSLQLLLTAIIDFKNILSDMYGSISSKHLSLNLFETLLSFMKWT